MRGICYSFYNSLTLLYAEIAGRFYGGGVLELSPKEFRSLPFRTSSQPPRNFISLSGSQRLTLVMA